MDTPGYGTAPDGKQQTAFLRDLVSAHFPFSQTFAIEQFDGFFHCGARDQGTNSQSLRFQTELGREMFSSQG
jgi:hypothetical protein